MRGNYSQGIDFEIWGLEIICAWIVRPVLASFGVSMHTSFTVLSLREAEL
jgi:hypothetical protein